jgi:hypothetical protein
LANIVAEKLWEKVMAKIYDLNRMRKKYPLVRTRPSLLL